MNDRDQRSRCGSKGQQEGPVVMGVLDLDCINANVNILSVTLR